MTDGVESIPLKEPVKVTLKRAGADPREETFTELQLHPFKARDLRAIDGLPDSHKGSMLLALMARMVRQPVLVIEELGGEDFAVLGAKVQGFLPAGLTDGGTD